MQKKVGFLWVDVPCVDNVGSCNYDDLCASIPFPPGEPCPEPFLTLGLPCNCPVAQVCCFLLHVKYFCSMYSIRLLFRVITSLRIKWFIYQMNIYLSSWLAVNIMSVFKLQSMEEKSSVSNLHFL